MTLAELDALPITQHGPLFQKEDDILFVRDQHGRAWMTGWIGDVRYKLRVYA